MEYMDGGSLADTIARRGCRDERTLAFVACQLMHGLHFMHRNRVIHRDIKPSNILICRDGSVRLADFGLAVELADREQTTDEQVGICAFMSPERLSGGAYSYASDVWAAGLSLAALALGVNVPFAVSSDGVPHWIAQPHTQPRLSVVFNSFSLAMQTFMEACMAADPGAQQRPAGGAVHAHMRARVQPARATLPLPHPPLARSPALICRRAAAPPLPLRGGASV